MKEINDDTKGLPLDLLSPLLLGLALVAAPLQMLTYYSEGTVAGSGVGQLESNLEPLPCPGTPPMLENTETHFSERKPHM